jgi:hypothetical protein
MGGRFHVIYIQDMLTLKLVDFKTFESGLKYSDAALFVLQFAKTLEKLDDTIFMFIKMSPFATKGFLNLMAAAELNCSFYNRSEILKIYYTHKTSIKHLIISHPDNISEILHLWNSATPQKLVDLKLKNEKPSS